MAVTEQSPEARRLQEALEMHEFGVALYRQRMRREHPQASEEEVDAMVRAWLAEPPREDRLRRPSGEES
jgi:Rv0078B-related antitoxin